MTIFERALSFVRDGDAVGLGSGRASTAFLHALGDRVKSGLRITAVPTSQAIADLAAQLTIPVMTLEETPRLAITVDGADEVDPTRNLIKGYGRALIREKIVATASDRLIILVGKSKLVTRLGQRGKLPIEVLPFAAGLVQRRLREMGMGFEMWVGRSDNGNMIFDLQLPAAIDPESLERRLREVPGIVGTGFFLKMNPLVLIGDEASNFELVEERN
jgi:ribose 5-phosphate isomerase A